MSVPGEPLEERMRELRLLEHQSLDEDEALRAAALDHVCGEGERRAGEADDRHRSCSAARVRRIASATKPVVSTGSGTTSLSMSAAVRSGEGNGARGRQSSSIPIASVGMRMSEKMIAASTPSRRTGWTVTSAARSGRLAEREELDLLPDGPVLREVATGLAHDPHRGHVHGLPSGGAQKAIVYGRWT